MKKKTSKLYRFITEGADLEDDEKLDVVPGLDEEDEEKKDEDNVTEEDDSEEDKEEVTEEDESEKDSEEVAEEDDSEKDKEEVTEEDVVNKGNEEGDIETQNKAFTAVVDDKLTEEDDSEEDKEEVTEEDENPEDKEEVTEEGELDQENPKGDIASKLGPNQNKEVSEEEEEEEGDEDLEEESAEDLEKKTDAEIEKIDVKEDIRALFVGKKLSNSFQKKAKTVFEAAIKKNVRKIVKKLQENYNQNIAKIDKKLTKKFAKDADKYLTYVAENWMKENKLAVERGIRTEITEEFISAFKTLCEQHNINLPESKFDVADKLAKKLEKTESQLNEALNTNIKLYKQLNVNKRKEIVRQFSKGLTATQSEKLAALAEGVVFKNTEHFTNSVKVLKESYFPNTVKAGKGETLVEGGLNVPQSGNKTDVDVYANYLEKTVKN